MEKDELMELSKKVFNFSPNESFSGMEQLLVEGRRITRSIQYYEIAAARIAEYMARYIDENEQGL